MPSGHITRRGKAKDRWTLVLELDPDPATGARRRKSIAYRGDKHGAEKHLRKLLTDLDKGELGDLSKWTVEQYLRWWLETHVATLEPKTQVTYRGLLEAHVIPHLGQRRLGKLTALEVETVYATLRRKPLGSSTIYHAVNLEVLGRNVLTRVRVAKPEKYQTQVWTPEQALRFVEYIVSDEDVMGSGIAMMLALETGLRKGEVLGLRWQSLTLEAGMLQVTQKIQRIPGLGLVKGQPKTDAGRRSVPLEPTMVALLRVHKDRQAFARRQLPGWVDADLVFCTPKGTPIDPRNMTRLFARAIKRAGVPAIRFHDLRHSYASFLLAGNVQTKLVSSVLGHATTSITTDIYQHILPGMTGEIAAKIDRLLHPPAANRQQMEEAE